MALRLTVPKMPVIETFVSDVTDLVSTVKVALFDPAGTVTDASTEADPLFEDSATTSPPCGAAPDRTTVPVEDTPPTTAFGETDIVVKAG